MDIEAILNGRKVRSLFDSGCNEFERLALKEKLRILETLNFHGLLENAIQKFIHHSKANNRWNERELLFTLKYYLKEITFNKMITISNYNDLLEEFKKELTKMTNSKYSLKRLIISYLSDDKVTFSKENQFFKIDFERDLVELTERDKKEGREKHESYTRLEFFKNQLISDYKSENFKEYPIEMGMDYQTEYVVKHYLKRADEESYLNALEYIFNVLYLKKEPYHQFFLFRVNFENGVVEDFKNKNQVAIRFDKEDDFEDWNKILNNEKPTQQYVQRWVQLNEALKENDIIVIASYKKLGYKIGVIPKNAEIQKIEINDKSFYIAFDLQDIKEIDLKLNPFVHTLLPSNVTISRVKRRNIKLRKLYYAMNANLQYNDFDDIAFEILVAEWLRTEKAPKEYRILYQLLKTGGNKSDIDIYGMTQLKEKLIVQISNTTNQKLINQKIKKLDTYSGFKKLFFFNVPDCKVDDYEVINLQRVISDLRSDEKYNELFEELE